jgi:hypothetical protein
MSVGPFLSDPAFPQLGIATDPGLMKETFRTHLRPVGTKVYDIEDCRFIRLRYRQDSRRFLLYTLRLVEPDTGRQREVQVTGLLYAEKNRAEQTWRKLQATDPRQEIPDAWLTFEPVSFVPELDMLVQVFPYDRRLPTLPLVMVGPSPELERPLLARFGPDNWHTEAWNVEPVRYRAELGAILRFTVQARNDTAGRTDERRFYAKVYRDEEGERTYRALQAIQSRADEGGEKFTVGTPITYLSRLHTLLQEETPGTSLQDLLLRDEDTSAVVRKAARALVALHLDDAVTPQRHRLQDEVTALERTGRLLRWACPDLGADIEDTIGAVVAGLEEVPPAPTHRDLKLDRILLAGDRLALLDLDTFAEADPIPDAANVLAHLACMPLRFPLLHDDRLRMATEIFAGEYFAHVPRSWSSRLPLKYAGAVLKAAVGFFRRQEMCWPEKLATLVREARNSSTGKVW